MDSQITYHKEETLSVPSGIPVESIKVRVTIAPADAACLAYGWTATGDLGYVEMPGGTSEVELPFVNPQIFLCYLRGLQSIQIATLGWREGRVPKPPNVPSERQH